jgi:hypothetical protein
MHIGGGDAKRVIRGEDPSSAGHGVAPSIEPPGATSGTLTGGPTVVLVKGKVVTDDAVVGVVLSPVRRAATTMPPEKSMSTKMAMASTRR